MESNIKGLVAAGHEMASELKAECGAVDMRSVAKLLSDLATQLEVQLVRANALAEDHQRAIESIKQADSAVKLAHEEFSALAAENAGLKAFKTAVYQQMGVGCDAPEFSITTGLSNLRRFADTLHAIEREFFTKELPDEEHEGETFNECPLSWGMSVEQYVSEFRKCLAEVRAQGVDAAIEAAKNLVAQEYEYKDFKAAQSDCCMHPGSDLVGKVEMTEWLVDFAAQLRKGGNQ
ncbi:eae-like domain protein [Escherichia albertii]|uniref:eae-like domain protein n=1 Tax=Escherichia albertii TaxID=208962 RepID=UPI00235F0309|nr:eae-like domain protein [Escherichia albertii]MCZ8881312.1 eae-like domain protein [Escherichia albertii]WDB89460.1 eae-like domain protein [Escherichia albertii]